MSGEEGRSGDLAAAPDDGTGGCDVLATGCMAPEIGRGAAGTGVDDFFACVRAAAAGRVEAEEAACTF